MSITQFAIEKNRITFILILVIILGGISAYTEMSRSEDPGFIIRTAAVVTIFPGASPERVELLVTDKIEKVVQEIPELDFVNSESSTGLSFIFVNIKENEKDMRPIWDDLRRKVASIDNLPQGIIGPTVNDEYGDVFGIIVSLTGEGYSYAELKDIADDVRDELLFIPNAAKVEISGQQEERVFVEYDNAKLSELGVTSSQLQNILESRNILISGGSIKIDDERLVLEPSGNFESVEDLKRTIISLGPNESVYLEDIALIYRDYVDPPVSILHANGSPGLALSISLKDGGNIIDLGDDVESTINRLQNLYPYGVNFDMISYQHRIVDKKVNDFIGNLLQAVIVVLIVMLLFLGFRTGLIVASLIPMAIIMALMIMGFMDIGLDQISLAALIIALGMLVDNAIVMSESIMVRLENGEEVKHAAIKAAAELRIPLLTSSLTTCAAFLPIFLAKSTTGEYTAPLFKVVTITLLSSWILSLTLIPVLCVMFLKVKAKENEKQEGKWYGMYRSVLVFSLKKPIVILISAVGLFALSLYAMGFVPSIFFPKSDRNLVVGTYEMPIGTDIEKTEEILNEIERFIQNKLLATETKEGIENWAVWIGGGTPKYVLSFNPGGKSSEIADLVLNTSDHRVNNKIAAQIDSFCLMNFPDLKSVTRPIEVGPPVDNPVEIRISGKDIDKLFEIVDEAKAKLVAIPGAKTISDDWGARVKKIVVNVDQARARNAGLTSQDIAISLQTVLSGVKTSEYREADKIIPIIMRNVKADRQDISKLETLNIYAQASGKSVPLKQVADLEIQWEPSKIFRRNRFKTVTVSSQLEEGITAAEIENELFAWAKAEQKEWPIGYKYEAGGTAESSGKANESIAAQLPIGLFIILMLLVGQFNSFRKPLVILLTIPLGMIGVSLGLLIMDSYMGFMTFLGIIALSGIVINNAIVLIDTIDLNLQEGMQAPKAIVEAAISRFRPIMLTTCTTMVGLIPLYLGGGPMFEPMAIAIIFGLLFATMLTLLFVPVLYRLFFRVSYREY